MGGGTGPGGKIDVRIVDEGTVVYGVVQGNSSNLKMDGSHPISGSVWCTGDDIEAMHGRVVRIEVISTTCHAETGIHTIPHRGCFLR